MFCWKVWMKTHIFSLPSDDDISLFPSRWTSKNLNRTRSPGKTNEHPGMWSSLPSCCTDAPCNDSYCSLKSLYPEVFYTMERQIGFVQLQENIPRWHHFPTCCLCLFNVEELFSLTTLIQLRTPTGFSGTGNLAISQCEKKRVTKKSQKY